METSGAELNQLRFYGGLVSQKSFQITKAPCEFHLEKLQGF